MTRTGTRIATKTITPTRTKTPVPVIISLEYKAGDLYRYSSTPHPQFRVYNRGTAALDISKLQIRYWYKYDGTLQPEQSFIDWAGVNGTPVTSAVSCSIVPGIYAGVQNRYLRVVFSASAGMLGYGQNDFLEVNTRFNKQDYAPYDQANDWSFTEYPSFTQWNKVTVYYNGLLVWGYEPSGGPGFVMNNNISKEYGGVR